MPIGKNSLKRVTSGANAKAEAPKETSIEEKSKEAKEKKATAPRTGAKKVEKAPSTKAPAKKRAPKKSMESEPELSPVKTAEKVVANTTKNEERQGEGYVNLGGELPDYLL